MPAIVFSIEDSARAVAAWQRHFLPAPRRASGAFFAPAPAPELGFAGRDVEPTVEGCRFAPLSLTLPLAEASPRWWLELDNRGQLGLTLEIDRKPLWLDARWPAGDAQVHLERGGGRIRLELGLASGQDLVAGRQVGTLWLNAEDDDGERRAFSVQIELEIRLEGARGRYDFDHASVPPRLPIDLGAVSPLGVGPGACSFLLELENEGSEPLTVTLENLPEWLIAELPGEERKGPVEGVFHQTRAPLAVRFRPYGGHRALGPRLGRVLVRTNDLRPTWREIPLTFSVRFESERAALELGPLPSRKLAAGSDAEISLSFLNWGEEEAAVALAPESASFRGLSRAEIPAAFGGAPGTGQLRLTLATAGLAPGLHRLPLEVEVEGAAPLHPVLELVLVRLRADSERLELGEVRLGQEKGFEIEISAEPTGSALELEVECQGAWEGILACECDSTGRVRGHLRLPADWKVEGALPSLAPAGLVLIDRASSARLEIPVTFVVLEGIVLPPVLAATVVGAIALAIILVVLWLLPPFAGAP